MAEKKSYISTQGVAQGLPVHHVYDTAAEMPASNIQEGDTAYSKDNDKLYKATSTTTWSEITSAGAPAASDLTGTVSVASGGTGASNAAGARTAIGVGTVGVLNTNASTVNFLRGDGTWVTPSAGSVAASDITGSLSLIAQSGLLPLSRGVYETLSIANGGTGQSNATDARTALGLGSLATQSGTFSGTSSGNNTGDLTLSGTPDYITISGQVITRSEVDLATDMTGTLSVARGGTGASSGPAAYTSLGVMGASNLSGTISMAQGGTNASSASGARTNLGLGTLATQNTVALATDTTGSLSLIAQTGPLPGATGISGLISTANLGTGTATDSKFLKGDQTWATPSSGPVSAVDITGSLSLITQSGLLPLARGVLETLAMVNGGTGASNATSARTNLGLGSLATANSIVLTTDTTGTLSIGEGGTNASNATDARSNLGLGSIATLSSVTLVTNTIGTLSVAQGGTGASSGSAAYTNLGTMAASNLSGTVSVASGGTGASSSAGITATLDTFTSALKGLAPASGGGSTAFLRADGSWAVPAGGSGITQGQAIATALGYNSN